MKKPERQLFKLPLLLDPLLEVFPTFLIVAFDWRGVVSQRWQSLAIIQFLFF